MTGADAGVIPSVVMKRHAPATERNRAPILTVLESALPASGTVLEVAAGTGEHAAIFAPRLAPRLWLPSDPDADNLASIAAWAAEASCDRLLPPIALDVTAAPWPVETDPPPEPVTAIAAINLIHIAPWAAAEGLMAGAGRLLPSGGVLYLYGPYKIDGRHTAQSNAAFDASLKARDPAWGVRDMADVAALAGAHGLDHGRTEAMPANNVSLVFTRR